MSRFPFVNHLVTFLCSNLGMPGPDHTVYGAPDRSLLTDSHSFLVLKKKITKNSQ